MDGNGLEGSGQSLRDNSPLTSRACVFFLRGYVGPSKLELSHAITASGKVQDSFSCPFGHFAQRLAACAEPQSQA